MKNYLTEFASLVKRNAAYKKAKAAAEKAERKKSAAYKKAVAQAKRKMKKKYKTKNK